MKAVFGFNRLAATADYHDGIVFVPVAGDDLDCSTVTDIHNLEDVAFWGWNVPDGMVPCWAVRDGNQIIIGDGVE
jgi:hypothetical protein